MTGPMSSEGEDRAGERCHCLDEVLDGELAAGAAERLHRHLAQCPECVEEIERVRILKELVRRSCAGEMAPRSLRERISVEYRRVSITTIRRTS